MGGRRGTRGLVVMTRLAPSAIRSSLPPHVSISDGVPVHGAFVRHGACVCVCVPTICSHVERVKPFRTLPPDAVGLAELLASYGAGLTVSSTARC